MFTVWEPVPDWQRRGTSGAEAASRDIELGVALAGRVAGRPQDAWEREGMRAALGRDDGGEGRHFLPDGKSAGPD